MTSTSTSPSTNSKTPTPKNPPMAQAVRIFVDDMMFVSIGKRSPDRTFKLASLVGAMLLHCHGLKPEAEVAYCTPANSQLARYLHTTDRTVKRLMADLKEGGNVTTRRRGTDSNLFTIYKYPRSPWGPKKVDGTTPVLSNDGTAEDSCGDSNLRTIGQQAVLDGTAGPDDGTAKASCGDNTCPPQGYPLRLNTSGKNNSGKNTSGTSSKGADDSTGRLGVSEVGGSDSPKEDLVTFEAFKAILDSAVQILPGEPAYQLDGEIHRVIDSGKVKSAYEWRTAILFRKAEINEQAAKGTRPNYKHPNTTDWLLWDFWVLCGRFAGPKSDASAKLLADMNGAAQAGFQVV